MPLSVPIGELPLLYVNGYVLDALPVTTKSTASNGQLHPLDPMSPATIA